MAKTHSKYTCQQCGYVSPQYLGKCPECENWNTFVETTEVVSRQASGVRTKTMGTKPVKLSDIKSDPKSRTTTGISELDHVLGGGIVPGQVILLAGEPGVGKSTLLLQVAKNFGGQKTDDGKLMAEDRKRKTEKTESRILYASGEESTEQIYLRARRLGLAGKTAESIQLQSETNVESIIAETTPNTGLLIVDSIQTMWTEDLTGAPGSVGQVRETTYRLIQHVKSQRTPLIIVGQVTKEGSIAGPKVLEHLVDTVLYMEGMQYEETRLLRVSKNRFGPTDEIAVFMMKEDGLTEVANPSENFLSHRDAPAAGQAVVVTMEGSRPLLVELQALVVPTELAIPRRVATGINSGRLSMICAILSKHLRLPLGKFDVFVNVSGGFTIREPAADLGVALSIFSSLKNQALPTKSVAIGELSLLGEIQAASNQGRRVKEAKRLGFIKVLDNTASNSLVQLIRKL